MRSSAVLYFMSRTPKSHGSRSRWRSASSAVAPGQPAVDQGPQRPESRARGLATGEALLGCKREHPVCRRPSGSPGQQTE